ncbi:MAG: hypothetical protein ABH950_10220 [Candidatus Altiarchaeota archaeon]
MKPFSAGISTGTGAKSGVVKAPFSGRAVGSNSVRVKLPRSFSTQLNKDLDRFQDSKSRHRMKNIVKSLIKKKKLSDMHPYYLVSELMKTLEKDFRYKWTDSVVSNIISELQDEKTTKETKRTEAEQRRAAVIEKLRDAELTDREIEQLLAVKPSDQYLITLSDFLVGNKKLTRRRIMYIRKEYPWHSWKREEIRKTLRAGVFGENYHCSVGWY